MGVKWREDCRDPEQMFRDLEHRLSERKALLLMAAFCRRIEHLMSEDRCKRLLTEAKRFGTLTDGPTTEQAGFLLRLVDGIERYADGKMTVEELDCDRELAEATSTVMSDYYGCYDVSWGPIDTDLFATSETARALDCAIGYGAYSEVAALAARAVHRAGGGEEQNTADAGEEAAQCDLIRDVIYHPQQAVAISDGWRTSDVLALARGIYADRAFDRMPILADALQDAGCDNEELLHHCRGGGLHVRGCWVIDRLLDLE